VLVGYVGNLEVLEAIHDAITIILQANPRVVVVVDPVCGDNGKFVRPRDLAALLCGKIVSPCRCHHAQRIRSSCLLAAPSSESTATISTDDDAVEVRTQLLERYQNLSAVVLTSVVLEARQDSKLHIYGRYRSTAKALLHEGTETIMMDVNRIDGYFSGTGDLFSALLLCEIAEADRTSNTAFVDAVRNVVAASAEDTGSDSAEERPLQQGAAADASGSLPHKVQ